MLRRLSDTAAGQQGVSFENPMAQSNFPRGTPPGEEPSQAAIPVPRPSQPANEASLKTILVVDDQPAVSRSVAFYLEKCGYRTHQADSGDVALQLLGCMPVDGVLLDIQMPKMNGFETCIRLHELARAANRPLKIWFMTGINYRELPDECAKAGGLGVFHKPFDWPLLLAELDRGFGLHPTRPPAPAE
jgi:CheY-like chemotaxis protein